LKEQGLAEMDQEAVKAFVAEKKRVLSGRKKKEKATVRARKEENERKASGGVSKKVKNQ
jgi:hypothetical protein